MQNRHYYFTMRGLTWGAAVIFTFGLFVSSAVTDEQDRWVELFDGRSLTGWTVQANVAAEQEQAETYWRVEDGAIVCDTRGEKSEGQIWLCHRDEFDDFELTLKVQTYPDAPGNTGVQVRSRFDKEAGWLDGPQVEIHPGGPWRSGFIYDVSRGEQRWISPSRKSWSIEKSAAVDGWRWQHADEGDGWNELRIICKGTRIQTIVNGVMIRDYDGDGVLNDANHRKRRVGMSGKICLQLHAKHAMNVRFKDIRLRPLK